MSQAQPENSDDWLNEPAHDYPVAKPDEGAPADAELTALPVAADTLDSAITAVEKRGQFIAAWGLMTVEQKTYINTWRECRFNSERTLRVLKGVPGISKSQVHRWVALPAFKLVVEMTRAASVEQIMSRDYLAARQEDIVETLLTPKPILHQGVATGHFEVEASAAGKANEVLLKLGGHLKDKEVDLNVGIVGPSFTIQVVQPDNTVKTLNAAGVTVALPEPAESSEEDWLDGA